MTPTERFVEAFDEQVLDPNWNGERRSGQYPSLLVLKGHRHELHRCLTNEGGCDGR